MGGVKIAAFGGVLGKDFKAYRAIGVVCGSEGKIGFENGFIFKIGKIAGESESGNSRVPTEFYAGRICVYGFIDVGGLPGIICALGDI